MRSRSTTEGGIGLSTVVLIVFIILKLTGNIDWSWWLVLSPLWISLGSVLIITLILVIGSLISRHRNNKRYKSRTYFESKEEDTESEFDEF